MTNLNAYGVRLRHIPSGDEFNQIMVAESADQAMHDAVFEANAEIAPWDGDFVEGVSVELLPAGTLDALVKHQMGDLDQDIPF